MFSSKKPSLLLILIAVMSLLVASSGTVLALDRTTSSTTSTTDKLSLARSALIADGYLAPVEGRDTSVVPMAKAQVNESVSGVTVTVYRSYNSQVSSTGAVTYGTSAVTGDVTFKLSYNGSYITQPLQVRVPAKTAVDPNADKLAAAKAALLSDGYLAPVQGRDTNVVSMAQSVVDDEVSGVTVSLYRTYNSQVSSTGAVTYGASAVTGDVTFKLTYSSSYINQPLQVRVPASTVVNDPDATQVTAAKSALAAAGTLKPVEGTDTNTVAMAQTIVNAKSSGVTVSVSSTANSQVSSTGTITYGASAVSGNVTFKLVKNAASATQSVTVAVPAHTGTDAEQVAAAKAVLAAVATLYPVEGTNTNVVTMAQNIVNAKVSGVTISLAGTANSQVSTTGAITYGASAVTGNVTFGLAKNNAAGTQVMSVAVPAKAAVSGYNVKNYGARGDGVTDDTNAIQSAINKAYSAGGGTVNIPDGTYLVNPDNSITLRSNIKLILSSNATLKAKSSSNGYYDIILIQGASNVEVSGGKIIGDRYIHNGTSGEWGSGISVLGSNYVTISDIDISNCWGDGIFIGPSWTGTVNYQNYSNNVTIEDFISHNNRRQGISVISAKNLIIRDGECSNQNGTAPESGIDLEPNYKTEFLQNILIDNVVTKYNAIGILVSLPNYVGSANPLSVTINNTSDVGSPYPISFYKYYESATCKINVTGIHGRVTSYY